MRKFLKRLQKNLQRRELEKKKQQDLAASANLDVSSVETICLALGPSRSFTTVTASVVAQHPQCLAINHGGRMILGDPRLDFIGNYHPDRADRFLRYAMHISLSSAQETSPVSLARPNRPPKAFLWNEPQRTANHLRRHNIKLDQLFEREPRLRFVQTIRHPIHSAYSHQKSGMTRHLGLQDYAPVENILDAILGEIHWFLQLNRDHPERFFHFFDHEFEAEKARKLAEFLRVDAEEHWVQMVGRRFEGLGSKRHSDCPEYLVEQYVSTVNSRFGDFPDARRRLLHFLES